MAENEGALVRCFRIAVVGDIHVGFDEASTRAAHAALADTRNVDPDALLLTGDVVDLHEPLWQEFRVALESAARVPRLISRGNADLSAGGDGAWDTHVGHPVRAVLDMGPFRFLTLGAVSREHEMDVGPDPGRWILEQAGARLDADVIVLCHAPLRDTTFWSCRNTEDGCLAELLPATSPPYHLYLRDSDSVAAALRQSTNVRMFITGHVHHDGRLSCSHGYGAAAVRDGVIHLVTGNIGGWMGIGVPRKEYHVVELSDGQVRVRARDFLAGAWVDEMELRFPRWPARTES